MTSPSADKLLQLVNVIQYDLQSLAGGSRSSATQARKRLSEASKLCTQLRKETLEFSKSLKASKKPKAAAEASASDSEEKDVEDLADSVAAATIAEAPKKKRGRKSKK